MNNCKIVHLDISYNSIGLEDTKVIGELMKQNHSLYGIHYQGNEGYVDPNGFIVNHQTQSRFSYNRNSLLGYQSKDGKSLRFKTSKFNHEQAKVKNGINCWICEGW